MVKMLLPVTKYSALSSHAKENGTEKYKTGIENLKPRCIKNFYKSNP